MPVKKFSHQENNISVYKNMVKVIMLHSGPNNEC